MCAGAYTHVCKPAILLRYLRRPGEGEHQTTLAGVTGVVNCLLWVLGTELVPLNSIKYSAQLSSIGLGELGSSCYVANISPAELCSWPGILV